MTAPGAQLGLVGDDLGVQDVHGTGAVGHPLHTTSAGASTRIMRSQVPTGSSGSSLAADPPVAVHDGARTHGRTDVVTARVTTGSGRRLAGTMRTGKMPTHGGRWSPTAPARRWGSDPAAPPPRTAVTTASPPPRHRRTATWCRSTRGVAHTSRIYDYLLGGTNHFAVDREVAEYAFAAYPGRPRGRPRRRPGQPGLPRAGRAVPGRAVGLRQFLDIGSGIPDSANTHQRRPGGGARARVVYVDNDPIVLAHAHALLAGSPRAPWPTCTATWPARRRPRPSGRHARPVRAGGAAAGRDPARRPRRDDPHGSVATLVDALAPGSHVVISHLSTRARRGRRPRAGRPPPRRAHAHDQPAGDARPRGGGGVLHGPRPAGTRPRAGDRSGAPAMPPPRGAARRCSSASPASADSAALRRVPWPGPSAGPPPPALLAVQPAVRMRAIQRAIVASSVGCASPARATATASSPMRATRSASSASM